ncbi:tyrosine-type recombinase/integrase [Comamonas sp. w2-DMI]|uniref:tyrosine-type recombinase/integrase n=1 Tax=Comamonas sp. w2-DMI TaxID=3126391 RepID=UPI0032E3C4A7
MHSHPRLPPTALEDCYSDLRTDSPLDDNSMSRLGSEMRHGVTSVSNKPKSADAFFDAWIAHVNETAVYGKESIDPTRSTSYRFIWRSWCKYLASSQEGPNAPYTMANPLLAVPVDVSRFLASGMKGSKPGRAISDVTRRRYYSVLQRIYAFCASQAWMECSPLDTLAQQDIPMAEKHTGSILTPQQWDACTRRYGNPAGNTFEIRDHAILMLLFKLGLRPEEIRALRVQDFQIGIADMPTLRILPRSGPAQERTLPLDDQSAEAIQNWKRVRKDLAVVINTNKALQADFNDDRLRAASDTLFVTRSSMELAKVPLLNLVKAHIERSCSEAGLEMPVRMGPQIVRNTRLIIWLHSGLEVDAVAVMAGLKNRKGFLHLLDYCSESVKQKIQPYRRRDDDPVSVTNMLKE